MFHCQLHHLRNGPPFNHFSKVSRAREFFCTLSQVAGAKVMLNGTLTRFHSNVLATSCLQFQSILPFTRFMAIFPRQKYASAGYIIFAKVSLQDFLQDRPAILGVGQERCNLRDNIVLALSGLRMPHGAWNELRLGELEQVQVVLFF